jgi:transcriptional regulator with XRE-family HTH domain
VPGRRRRTRAAAALAARERASAVSRDLGAQVKAALRRRRWSYRRLGEKVGLSGQRVGQIAGGHGSGASLEVWFAIAAALGLPLSMNLGRDPFEAPPDAGHLRIQELVLRLARETGRRRTFELATRPADPALSADVGVVDSKKRVLMLVECWNTFGSINAAVRNTRRKLAEAEALAIAIGGDDGAYRVAGCWVVRDTRRNRALIASYPEVFSSAFHGASLGWVRALTRPEAEPPAELGLVWSDLAASRVFAWRARRAVEQTWSLTRG